MTENRLTRAEIESIVSQNMFTMQNTDWAFTDAELFRLNGSLISGVTERDPPDEETAIEIIKTIRDRITNSIGEA